MHSMTNKVAIVTGASSGIGRASALLLAREGASVVVGARGREGLATLVAEIAQSGGRAFCVAGDVGDEAFAQEMVHAAIREFGGLDVAFNNAGTIGDMGPTPAVSAASWRQTLETNLTSAFLCSRDAYPHLKAAGGGKIVNIGSMMSIFGTPFAPAYAASKGGIVQLTKSLATAWAGDHIQVNAVLPGWIDTELTRSGRQELPEFYNRVLGRIPDGRWGEEQDMAGIAVFLSSSASDYITGAAIPVDGGYSSMGI